MSIDAVNNRLPACDVVIVNWNSGQQLYRCLHSLAAEEREIKSVTVVDNGSSDGSADIEIPFSFSLEIIKNAENLGFATACNQGAKIGSGEYILFLNPDAEVFHGSICEPVRLSRMESHEKTGIFGIKLVGDSGSVERGCCRIPKLSMFLSFSTGLDRWMGRYFPSHKMHEWDHLVSRHVDHVIGAFYLIRRTVFEKLQGFDERFFVYLEDLDLSCRVRNAGYGCFYCSEAQAYHKGGGVSEQVQDIRLFYSLRSRIIYGIKHFEVPGALLLLFCMCFLEPVIRALYLIAKRRFTEFRALAKAYLLFYRELPLIFKEFFQKKS